MLARILRDQDAAGRERRHDGDGRAVPELRRRARRLPHDARPRRVRPRRAPHRHLDRRAGCRASSGWPRSRCSCGSRSRCTRPTDELRSELMPVTRRYPLERLMAACRDYRDAHRPPDLRRVPAARRGERLRRRGARRSAACSARAEGFHVNLIAYNPTAAGYSASPPDPGRPRSPPMLRGSGVGSELPALARRATSRPPAASSPSPAPRPGAARCAARRYGIGR